MTESGSTSGKRNFAIRNLSPNTFALSDWFVKTSCWLVLRWDDTVPTRLLWWLREELIRDSFCSLASITWVRIDGIGKGKSVYIRKVDAWIRDVHGLARIYGLERIYVLEGGRIYVLERICVQYLALSFHPNWIQTWYWWRFPSRWSNKRWSLEVNRKKRDKRWENDRCQMRKRGDE